MPPLGIPADIALQAGVTTIVDAGSYGADTFLQEKEEIIDHATVRVLAFLNIVANGMQGDLEQTVGQIDRQKMRRHYQEISRNPGRRENGHTTGPKNPGMRNTFPGLPSTGRKSAARRSICR